ncbi:subclass B3 metallo-beta-lactamase [Caulobacter sp. CCUG 60055]|uniref:subclass B3 metallo-beta-lactamase n=1 Tax=Caulobacter sp. CCUG 60055 TaxID=2100090 RepID=UPI001FA748FD
MFDRLRRSPARRFAGAGLLLATTLAASAAGAASPDLLTRPIETPFAEKWLRPQAPARIYGDSYYVGFGGLSLVLIQTAEGLILIDGALPQSAAAVEAHVRSLGFRVEDIRYILNTEAHYDHAGGVAALARDSGATVVASPASAAALRAGRVVADDPQAGDIAGFPAIAKIREVRDGEVLRLGGVAVTARFTPGHTPGSTSWTWKSCEGGRCLDMVFAASLNPVSAEGFHFLADSRHGDLTAAYRRSIRAFAALPCDVLISAHPDHSGVDDKLRRLAESRSPNPFIDPAACRTYADKYEAVLDARIAKERAAAVSGPK